MSHKYNRARYNINKFYTIHRMLQAGYQTVLYMNESTILSIRKCQNIFQLYPYADIVTFNPTTAGTPIKKTSKNTIINMVHNNIQRSLTLQSQEFFKNLSFSTHNKRLKLGRIKKINTNIMLISKKMSSYLHFDLLLQKIDLLNTYRGDELFFNWILKTYNHLVWGEINKNHNIRYFNIDSNNNKFINRNNNNSSNNKFLLAQHYDNSNNNNNNSSYLGPSNINPLFRDKLDLNPFSMNDPIFCGSKSTVSVEAEKVINTNTNGTGFLFYFLVSNIFIFLFIFLIYIIRTKKSKKDRK